MSLVTLGERPEFFPIVAQWIWEEWRGLLVQRSAAEFAAWFRSAPRGDGLPTTLAQIEDGVPVGTVSLECDDMEIRPDLTPWLASLYVVPALRGRGIGRGLVRAAEDAARERGCTELFLYTPGQEDFYAGLGWVRVESCRYRTFTVTIMRRALTP